MASEQDRTWSPRYRDDFETVKADRQMSFIRRFVARLDGEYIIEYGLLIALLVLAAGAMLMIFNTDASDAFTALGSDNATQVK